MKFRKKLIWQKLQNHVALIFSLNSNFTITVLAENTSLAEAEFHFETQLIYFSFGKLSQQFPAYTKKLKSKDSKKVV